MTTLQLEGDPSDVGMSASRLARIDTHFRKYVDDGRLPGWLISVSRHGKLVHVKLGQYAHDSELEEDIKRYALGGA